MSFYFQFTAFFFFCILNIFGQSRTHYCRCWKVYQMSECRSIEERQRGKVIVDKKNVSKTCWLNWFVHFWMSKQSSCVLYYRVYRYVNWAARLLFIYIANYANINVMREFAMVLCSDESILFADYWNQNEIRWWYC